MKADIVVHPNSARVFLDADARPAKLWTDEDGTQWTGWSHAVPLAVDAALLDEMYSDPFVIRVWDTRDRVSAKARFDRPKPSGTTVRSSGGDACSTASGPNAGQNGRPPSGVGHTTRDAEAAAYSEKVLNEVAGVAKFAAAEDGTGSMMQMWLHNFFVGTTECSQVWDCTGHSTGLTKISKVRVTASLSRPLLSPLQLRELNPLRVTVQSVEHMPSTPISYDKLAAKCHRPYVQLGFPGRTTQKLTATSDHRGPSLRFDQSFIVLTGKYSREELEDFYRGDGIRIEVHDRDRMPHNTKLDVLFSGSSEMDNIFNDFDSAVGVRLTNVEAKHRAPTESYDPYGVAYVPLADLMAGARVLNMECPVLPGPRSDGPASSNDGQVAELPTYPGHYIEAGTAVIVRVELSHPHHVETQPAAVRTAQAKCDSSFSHCVVVLDGVDKNAEAIFAEILNLGNAITTVHIAHTDTTERQLLIIEGLANAVADVWARVVDLLPADSPAPLYNSNISLSHSLYHKLSPGLHTFRLPQSIHELLQRSDVYVKDSPGWRCLTGLTQLKNLLDGGETLEEVYRDGGLPSIESLLDIGSVWSVG